MLSSAFGGTDTQSLIASRRNPAAATGTVNHDPTRKSKRFTAEQSMEKRLVTILKKEQLRLIVTKKFLTSNLQVEKKESKEVVNEETDPNNPIYKLEKCNTTKSILFKVRSSDVKYLEAPTVDLTQEQSQVARKHVQSDTAIGKGQLPVSVQRPKPKVLHECKAPDENANEKTSRASKLKSEELLRIAHKHKPTSLSFDPKEYRCFVKFTTPEFNWPEAVQCGDLTQIVTHMRRLNQSLNELYIQWQSRLMQLVRNQQDIIADKGIPYFEWCILKVLVQLVEGISTSVPQFFVTYSEFLKQFVRRKSFRKNATYSQIRRIDNNMCHFILNASNLKIVVDEYLQDLKGDFERLQALIGSRKLVRAAYGNDGATPKNFPWKDSYTETTAVISFQDPLAIRACKVLPWEKLYKKTMQIYEVERFRSRKINKLDKKFKKVCDKAKRKERKGKSFEATRLTIEARYKFARKSSTVEYRSWKKVAQIQRRFDWKYYVRNYRSTKFQKHWIMNRIHISEATKLLFMNRRNGIRERYQWELKNLEVGIPFDRLEENFYQHEVPEDEEVFITHEVSLLDIWTARTQGFFNSHSHTSSSDCGLVRHADMLTEADEQEACTRTRENEEENELHQIDSTSYYLEQLDPAARIMGAISTIQVLQEMNACVEKLREDHSCMAQEIQSLRALSVSMSRSVISCSCQQSQSQEQLSSPGFEIQDPVIMNDQQDSFMVKPPTPTMSSTFNQLSPTFPQENNPTLEAGLALDEIETLSAQCITFYESDTTTTSSDSSRSSKGKSALKHHSN